MGNEYFFNENASVTQPSGGSFRRGFFGRRKRARVANFTTVFPVGNERRAVEIEWPHKPTSVAPTGNCRALSKHR